MGLAELARSVKVRLEARIVQTIGAVDRQIQRVAVVCGAGGEFLNDALCQRADVLLTGELRFHDYLSAQAQGLALILPGHYATERCGVEDLASQLQARWPELRVWASTRERDPIAHVDAS
jgi:putative NIF3 family GTP cyclohydrolase 1 type 2